MASYSHVQFARLSVPPLVGTQFILNNQFTKSVLLVLCLPSDRFPAGVQCGLPAFLLEIDQDIDSSLGCATDTNTSCQANNTLTFDFNSSTIPAGAQSVLCGLNNKQRYCSSLECTSKRSPHDSGIFLISSYLADAQLA